MNNQFKQVLEYLSIIALFIAISFLYSSPQLEGKELIQNDRSQYLGAAKEKKDFDQQSEEATYWTNSMFGGMPTYLISSLPPSKTLTVFHKALNLFHSRPAGHLFLYMLGFFICLISFKVNKWLALIGSLAYAFSSYFLIIIEAGHIAKVMALGYLPPIIGGIHLAFNGKKLLGSIILGLFLALQILTNHPQMTYYTGVIAIVYGLVFFFIKIKENEIKDFIYSASLLIVLAAIAMGSNMGSLLPTAEYTNYSIRGKSDLVLDEKNQTDGLDIDYATDWSYGISETFTLLIPNFMGGASGGELPEDSETYKIYEQYQGKSAAKKAVKRQPTYWGKVIFTSGPVYVGAIICFLFVFAFFIVEKKYLWWLGIATFISFIFAWGKHIPNITQFLFEYLPLYSKFRAVSSALVIAEFAIPMLAVLALGKLFNKKTKKEDIIKALKYSVSITGGIILFFILFAKGLFDFEALSDEQYLAQQGGSIIVDALRADRLMLLRRDAFRSLIFVLLAAGAIYFYLKDKLKLNYAIAILGLLILVDLWGIGKRYLNNENFVSKREAENQFTASLADEAILKDSDPDYRVLNLAVSPFQDARTSYFHKSIGGYHGAKMRRYQELIDFHISNEMQNIFASFKTQDFNKILESLSKNNVLNMLNTKYIIYNPQAQPIKNISALGHAWFVQNVKWVNNANEEIDALHTFDPKSEAVIDTKFKSFVSKNTYVTDSNATIVLTDYAPNRLIYKTNTKNEQLAVFSEIYYPIGWNINIDGKSVEQFRVNYILRAINIPAGEHVIEFKFEADAYKLGHKITMASSIVLVLLILAAIGQQFYLQRKK